MKSKKVLKKKIQATFWNVLSYFPYCFLVCTSELAPRGGGGKFAKIAFWPNFESVYKIFCVRYVWTWNNLWDIASDLKYKLQKEWASFDKNLRIWWVGPGGGGKIWQTMSFSKIWKKNFFDTSTWLVFFPRIFQSGFHHQNIMCTHVIYYTVLPNN